MIDRGEIQALAEKRRQQWGESFSEMRDFLLSLPQQSAHKDKLLEMLRDKIEKEA